MNTSLIVLGIQAILRAAKTGADLYKEHARDRYVFLPLPEVPTFDSPRPELREFITAYPEIAMQNPAFGAVWNFENNHFKGVPQEQIHLAFTTMVEYKINQNMADEDFDGKAEAKSLAAGFMVEQWCKDRKPPSAMARMAITFVDIGLEFVKTDPSLFGIGGRGEKLVVGFATNLDALLPDPDDEEAVKKFSKKEKFADRVLGIFLRAGLGTIAEDASTVVRDENIAKLMEGAIKPIVEALPEDSIADQINYRNIVDALAGPSAEAVFRILSENTEDYLGKDFVDDKVLGVLTSELFNQLKQITHNGSVEDIFTEKAAMQIYQAALGIAVDQPQLFIKDDGTPETKLFQDLLKGAAQTLIEYPRFKGPVGVSMVAMAVEVVGKNAPALLSLDPDNPWENVALKAIEQVSGELNKALQQDDFKSALKLFSDDQLIEFGRIILTQAAQTPGMLGVDRTEVQVIVAGMAQAMAADDNLLLSSDEWIKIAGVAAIQAAANPGKLFGLSTATDDPGDALAVALIQSVLKVAGETWKEGGRTNNALLFGHTLEQALEAVLKALAKNIEGVIDNIMVVEEFFRRIIDLAKAHPNKFGSEGFLKVVQALIGKVLSQGRLSAEDEILAIVSE